jgi:hypothetical protein
MVRKRSTNMMKANRTDYESSNALSALKDGHRKVEDLFQKYTDATSRDEKAMLVKQVCAELLNQTKIEEEILLSTWPAGGTGFGSGINPAL